MTIYKPGELVLFTFATEIIVKSIGHLSLRERPKVGKALREFFEAGLV